MEQRAIVRFFILKSLNPRDIRTELLSVYGPNALALSMMYKWYQLFVDVRIELCDDPRSGRPLRNDLAEALGAMLQECTFTLCKKLCAHLRLAMTMCLYILHYVLLVKKFNLCWVLHALDSNQQSKRAVRSSELFEVVTNQGRNKFDHVITGDKLWFYFQYPHAVVWAPS
jgi:hypothetical protein